MRVFKFFMIILIGESVLAIKLRTKSKIKAKYSFNDYDITKFAESLANSSSKRYLFI